MSELVSVEQIQKLYEDCTKDKIVQGKGTCRVCGSRTPISRLYLTIHEGMGAFLCTDCLETR